MKKILLIFAAVALCFCACSNTKNAVESADGQPAVENAAGSGIDNRLLDTKWVLTDLNGQPVADAPVTPFITFAENKISGEAGCNSYFGTYFAHKKGRIDIQYTGSTKRLCSDMKVEEQFIQALRTEKLSYVVTKDVLIIRCQTIAADGKKKEVELLRFKAEKK